VTYHLSRLASTFHQQGNYRYLFLASDNEQSPGLIDGLLQQKVPLKLFKGLESKQYKSRLKGMLACLAFLRATNFKVLHTQSNFHLCLAILLKLFKRFELIHTIHSFHNGKGGIKMRLNKVFLHIVGQLFVSKLCVPSKFVFDSFPYLQDKTNILYLGYDADDVSVNNNTKLCLQPLKLIYCAKFHKAKNHVWLLKALDELLRSGRVELFLPGDGDELEPVRQMLKNNVDIEAGVFLPGWVEQEQVKALYAQSDVALVPSSSETFGHNIIEPLSFGTPVIAFPVGVAPDIESGSGVQCVPFFDQSALTQKLSEFYHDRHRLMLAKGDAKDIFVRHFSWSAHLNEYEGLLGSC